MFYWFSEFPSIPEKFLYTRERMQQDRAYLENLVLEIERLESNEYFLTEREINCRYCVYRSLCDRGIEAGTSTTKQPDYDDRSDEIIQSKFDFEAIPEIEF